MPKACVQWQKKYNHCKPEISNFNWREMGIIDLNKKTLLLRLFFSLKMVHRLESGMDQVSYNQELIVWLMFNGFF